MSREWETILEVIPSGKAVFRIADPGEAQSGPITVPYVGWRVLSKIDGSRTVQEIAEILRIPFAYTAKVIFNLHKAGLVEIVNPSSRARTDTVPPPLFDRLTSILTEAMGPMAPLVLRDQIDNLGESQDNFPETKLDDLIGLISKEISDGKLRQKVEESMLQEISNFKNSDLFYRRKHVTGVPFFGKLEISHPDNARLAGEQSQMEVCYRFRWTDSTLWASAS